VVKLLGFTCICVGEKTFYHPKFSLYALGLGFRLMQQFASKGIRRGRSGELGRRIILLYSSWKFVLRNDS